MRNSVRVLILFLAAQYMLDSSDDLLDLLAAPLFFRHTNRHRINGRKQRDREQEIRFLRYCRAIELHHYAILCVSKVDGVPIDQHKVKSTSRVFGNGPVQTAPLLESFETTLDHRSKPQEILGFQLLVLHHPRLTDSPFDLVLAFQEILGFQLGHLMANYSRIHLPKCVHKVLMTEFMLELSNSRAGESPCGHD